MTYRLGYVTQKVAFAFVAEHHRHHKPPQGAIVCIGAFKGDQMVGVAVVGRPIARMSADGRTAELTRVCVLEGHPNCASWLLTRAKRLSQAMGFERFLTYTLPSEGGASLRAAGFVNEGLAGGGSWSRPSRGRQDKHPTQQKIRWSASA